MKSWHTVPLALRVAVALNLLAALVWIAVGRHHDFVNVQKLQLAMTGAGFVAAFSYIVGALELAKLLVGLQAVGARIVAIGSAITLAFTVVTLAMQAQGEWLLDHRELYQWVTWAAGCITFVGVALVASRQIVAGVVIGMLLVAISRPPIVEHWMFEHFRDDLDTYSYINSASYLAHIALTLIAVLFAVRDLPEGFTIDETQRARLGLEWMAMAMWMRLVGLCVLPVLTLMLVAGNGHNAEHVLGYGMVFGSGLGVVSLALFGLGALDVVRSKHPAARRSMFYVAAFGTLWCAGVTLHQIPDLYSLMTGQQTEWGREFSFAQMFPYIVPLVAATGLVFGALAMGGFATQREHLELGSRGERVAVLVGLMELLALGVTAYLIPEARSTSSLLLLTVMALTFGLIAIVSLARLARDTAHAVEAAPPTVPTATVV